ncbi:MAG TPA: FKBP-type peptidyl-prolyl cis-trans isomerase [Gemmatimonadales bacterium]|jgi:FKBP-type peptidyl-prolyl cis-trans isomerase|nr:FKBP-type peptidyl-prolyl cis-trans isomerase [Gemmatimonadales bacterium]
MRLRCTGPAFLAAALILSACHKAAPIPGDIPTAKFDPNLHVDLKASTRMPDGLYYRDITVGSGPVAQVGQQASVNYTGWLVDGTQFDATRAGDPPLTFPLGAHRVIDGWDEGVAGMHVGGRRQLIIPPMLGYGAAGSGPIPPSAILVFTVDLIGVQ